VSATHEPLEAVLHEPVRCGVVTHQQPPQVRISSACPHKFRLVPFGPVTRWFRERGLVRTLRSGDGSFDAQWSLETDDVEFGEKLLRDDDARAAITALRELGAAYLTHTGRHLHAVLGNSSRRSLKDPERQAALELQLHALDAALSELTGARTFPRHRFHRRLFLTLLFTTLGLILLAVGGLAFWSRELVDGDLGPLALRSLIAGVPIGLAAVATAIVPLAGRTSSHKEAALLFVLGLPAVMLLCLAGALALNSGLDRGPVAQERVPVLQLRERTNDDHHRVIGYWAIVPSWRGPAGQTERISLSRERGAQVTAGSTWLDLQVSPGALGAARLLSVRIE
jgi:hypothetical protein